MKFLHTADWHIGRTLNGYSLLDEQIYAYEQILDLAISEEVDGIIIAGDLYDSSVPRADVVPVFEHMLRRMNLEEKIPIYAISGNHDSSKRLNFSRGWMQQQKLYLNTYLKEALTPIETADCQIFLLPFFNPIDLRIYLQELGWKEEALKSIKTITDAMKVIIPMMVAQFDDAKRQVLVTHFAVSATGSDLQDLTSETSSRVGGLSTLNVTIFSDFDYVALGHIHTRLASPSRKVQYAGSPVKFNTKEAQTDKGVYIVEVDETGVFSRFVKLEQKTDLVVLRETWQRLMSPAFYGVQPCHEAWFAVSVLDFERHAHAGQNLRAQLEQIYGTVVQLDYEEVQPLEVRSKAKAIEDLDEVSIIGDFYEESTGQSLTNLQRELVEEILVSLHKEDL